MQAEAQEAVDLSRESESTRALYGCDRDKARDFGRKCLLARRLVERGVRFVQVYCDGEWDAHGNLKSNHTDMCAQTDVPIAGLLTDLKRRGLLESTLVVWGGEFGRTPTVQEGEAEPGRDHHPEGFTMWMAGGGVKPGFRYGATDEFGYYAVEDRCTIHDFHATILHILGLDHEKLTYRHAGRDFRLTDVHGTVATRLLA